MKQAILFILGVFLLLPACTKQSANPFLQEWTTPFQAPPFNKIKAHHYLPAFKKGIQQQREEIKAITNNSAVPTFQNTLIALENSGELLTKVDRIFNIMRSSKTNDELQKIAEKVTPMLSDHNDDILLNVSLFKRIATLHKQAEQLDLNREQKALLQKYYDEFTRNGARLNNKQKQALRKLNKELSMLTLEFGDNVLKENETYELVIDNKKDLAGLPPSIISNAAEIAKSRNKPDKWVFILNRTSINPFLTYSEKRDLREQIYKAYINRGNHDNDLDNKSILARIAALRVKKARLLGYPTHADFVLEKNMAKTPQNVNQLLQKIWKPALEQARTEARTLQQMISSQGETFKLKPWDWRYYAEKVRKAQYNLDENEIKPYFQLENVRDGAFRVATKLYGLQFEKVANVPVYHKDVTVFEVKEADGSHVGLLYTDFYARMGKRGGAWMNHYRKQHIRNGQPVTPIVSINCNFSKASENEPALITFDQTLTLFHEFGHALHGLLSDCTYPKLSGTSVPRDFVELPSQIMENWAAEPRVLKTIAKHYQSGEAIPDELIEKLVKANKFNQGFKTVEYLAASFLDMDWHSLTKAEEKDVLAFENKSMQSIDLIPEIDPRYRSTYFQHIFAGGYSAGYYSYIWSEVLDADAFQAFKESSLFDPNTAQSFRENILSKGGTGYPMEMYQRFRGKEPEIQPLLERRGLD